MPQNFLILVEGVADITFLKDFLIHSSNNLTITTPLTKQNKKELILESTNKKIKIQAINGYTQIKNKRTEISLHIDIKYKILVIQDADNPNKCDGGLKNRLDYLENIKKELKIDFDTFLFPNHKDDGDLETLLLTITNGTLFSSINSSYINFYHEEIKLGGLFYHELIYEKNIIFNYLRTYYGMDGAKEDSRVYESTYWDLNSSNLKPLIDFFKRNHVI